MDFLYNMQQHVDQTFDSDKKNSPKYLLNSC